MTTQFAMTDAKAKPQKVHITWSMHLEHDDTCGPPDQEQDGYWPSLDPNDAGYIGKASKVELALQYAAAQERMTAWEACGWHYVGVIARADILIPIGGGSFRIMQLQSAGVWGVESDAGDYLNELYQEQRADLLGELERMSSALASGDVVEGEANA